MFLASGEEQILAIYLTKQNEAGEHDIVLPDGPDNYDGISLDEGFWEDIRVNPQYVARKKADKVSYVWDQLIEKFIKVGDPQWLKIPMTAGKGRLDVEPGLRIMASETRFRRRYLGEMLIGMLRELPPQNIHAIRAVPGWSPPRVYLRCSPARRHANL